MDENIKELHKITGYSSAAILLTFLEEEAKEYGQNWEISLNQFKIGDPPPNLNEKGKKYVSDLAKIITEECLKIIPDGCDYITITSCGNTGALNRSYTFSCGGEKIPWNWENGCATISLCICGKLNCWGSVILCERKNKKEK